MIRVVIEMDPTGSHLQIAADAPPPIVLGVVTAAYHELLSQKIQADFRAQSRIILPTDDRAC
jgi:hypothetical protein